MSLRNLSLKEIYRSPRISDLLSHVLPTVRISPAPNLCSRCVEPYPPRASRNYTDSSSGSSPIAKIIVVRLLADMRSTHLAVGFYTVGKTWEKNSKVRHIISVARIIEC